MAKVADSVAKVADSVAKVAKTVAKVADSVAKNVQMVISLQWSEIFGICFQFCDLGVILRRVVKTA